MFLDGTYHVLLIYCIVGCIICLPPLFLPQWESLVSYFNKKDIAYENFWKNFLFYCGIIITIIAIFATSYYNPHILGPKFGSRLEEIIYTFVFQADVVNFFLFFSLFAFIFLPLGLAFIGTFAYMKNSTNIKQGYLFIVFISLFALGLAASFFHDFLWCGTRTIWYTQSWDSGYDLVPWREFLHVESKDYRVFGFYMLILVIILLSYTAILINKYYSFLEEKLDKATKNKTFLISLLCFIILGVALYIVDFQRLYEFFSTFISLYVGIPLTAVLFYHLGNKLAI
ncbi:MAG: hypothetical protein HWN67_08180 [Candidatus Helarchaeota archaeon]|nr:hypothetical protein [Candidatus Helarchaeota archaeon]